MTGRSLWTRVAGGAVVALLSVLLVPVPPPTAAQIHPMVGVAVGAVLGVMLFVFLAGDRPHLPRRDQLTAAQALFLLGWAWVEEVLWRRLLLGGLAIATGAAVGLVAATALFALAHPQGRPTQIATGATFGSAYVVTGRLGAAIASHVVYNLLVAGSRRARGSA